jgi:hypothetical protein
MTDDTECPDEASIHGGYDRVCQRAALLTEIDALRRKLVNAELQQQATEDRVISALDTLAVWRERVERAESENRKLRDAWPDHFEGLVRRRAYKYYRLSLATGEDNWIAHNTRDEAINAAAGITDSKKEVE